MFASLEKGGCEAAVLTMPSFFVAEETRFSHPRRPRGDGHLLLAKSVDSTRSYLQANRAQAMRFAKGLIEGIAYFKKYKKESLGCLAKKVAHSVCAGEKTSDISKRPTIFWQRNITTQRLCHAQGDRNFARIHRR